MGSTLVAIEPGIYWSEEDLSQYANTLSTPTVAWVGPARKGVVNQPIFSGSGTAHLNNWGVPSEAYQNLLYGREFHVAGGQSSWGVRITDGTDVIATVTIPMGNGTDYEISAPTSGDYFNGAAVQISYANPTGTTITSSETLTVTSTQSFSLTLPGVPLVKSSLVLKIGGTTAATDDGNGNLVFGSGYSTYSGTVNYLTGVVSVTVTGVSSGSTITVLINASYYQNFTTQVAFTTTDDDGNPLTTLPQEEFQGCTASNFEANVALSNYLAPDDNPTHYLQAGTYQFSGGTNGASGLEDAHYIGTTIGSASTGLQCFSNPHLIDINVVGCPGQDSAAIRQAVISLCESRRDCVGPLDGPMESTAAQDISDWANGVNDFDSYGDVESTYAEIGTPWFTSYNAITGADEMTVPSAAFVETVARCIFSDAPAGQTRGMLQNCVGLAANYDDGDRGLLALNRINPIGYLNGVGPMLLGQQTATRTQSALDRLVTRFTLIALEKAIVSILYALLWEPDRPAAWARAENLAQPILTGMVNNDQLIYGFFKCDSTTNPSLITEQNVMAAIVQVIPVNTIERISLLFQINSQESLITEVT